jgi:hypothetical protein
MFDKRYSTRTVAEDVDLYLQIMMWGMIDDWKMQGKKLDYLQVFVISTECCLGEVYVKIEHHQEIPKIKETSYYKNIANPIDKKIFVIDDGEHATMMFAFEY